MDADEPPLFQPPPDGTSSDVVDILNSLFADNVSGLLVKNAFSALLKQLRTREGAVLMHRHCGELTVVSMLRTKATVAVVQSYGFVLMRKLACVCMESNSLFVENGAVGLICDALRRFPNDTILQASACGALVPFVKYAAPVSTDAVLSLGVLPMLVRLFLFQTDQHPRQIVVYAATVLVELCDQRGKHVVDLILRATELASDDEWLLLQTTAAMLQASLADNHDRKFTCAIATLLLCLMSLDRTATQVLQQLGAIPSISHAMVKYANDAGIQRYAATVCHQLAKASPGKSTKLKRATTQGKASKTSPVHPLSSSKSSKSTKLRPVEGVVVDMPLPTVSTPTKDQAMAAELTRSHGIKENRMLSAYGFAKPMAEKEKPKVASPKAKASRHTAEPKLPTIETSSSQSSLADAAAQSKHEAKHKVKHGPQPSPPPTKKTNAGPSTPSSPGRKASLPSPRSPKRTVVVVPDGRPTSPAQAKEGGLVARPSTAQGSSTSSSPRAKDEVQGNADSKLKPVPPSSSSSGAKEVRRPVGRASTSSSATTSPRKSPRVSVAAAAQKPPSDATVAAWGEAYDKGAAYVQALASIQLDSPPKPPPAQTTDDGDLTIEINGRPRALSTPTKPRTPKSVSFGATVVVFPEPVAVVATTEVSKPVAPPSFKANPVRQNNIVEPIDSPNASDRAHPTNERLMLDTNIKGAVNEGGDAHCVTSSLLAAQLVQAWIYETMDEVVRFNLRCATHTPPASVVAADWTRELIDDDLLANHDVLLDNSVVAASVVALPPMQSCSPPKLRPFPPTCPLCPPPTHTTMTFNNDANTDEEHVRLSVQASILAKHVVQAWIYETLDTVTRFSTHPPEHDVVLMRPNPHPLTVDQVDYDEALPQPAATQSCLVLASNGVATDPTPKLRPLDGDQEDASEGRHCVVSAMMAKQLVQLWLYEAILALVETTASVVQTQGNVSSPSSPSTESVANQNKVGSKTSFDPMHRQPAPPTPPPLWDTTPHNVGHLDEQPLSDNDVSCVVALLAKQLVQLWVYETLDTVSRFSARPHEHVDFAFAPPRAQQEPVIKGSLDDTAIDESSSVVNDDAIMEHCDGELTVELNVKNAAGFNRVSSQNASKGDEVDVNMPRRLSNDGMISRANTMEDWTGLVPPRIKFDGLAAALEEAAAAATSRDNVLESLDDGHVATDIAADVATKRPCDNTQDDAPSQDLLTVQSAIVDRQLAQGWLDETLDTTPRVSTHPSEHEEALARALVDEPPPGVNAVVQPPVQVSASLTPSSISSDASIHDDRDECNLPCVVSSLLAKELVQTWLYETIDRLGQCGSAVSSHQSIGPSPTASRTEPAVLSGIFQEKTGAGGVQPEPLAGSLIPEAADSDARDKPHDVMMMMCAMMAKQLVQSWVYETLDRVSRFSTRPHEHQQDLAHAHAAIGQASAVDVIVNDDYDDDNFDDEGGDESSGPSPSAQGPVDGKGAQNTPADAVREWTCTQENTLPMAASRMTTTFQVKEEGVNDGHRPRENDDLICAVALLAKQLVQFWIYETLETVSRFSAQPHEHHDFAFAPPPSEDASNHVDDDDVIVGEARPTDAILSAQPNGTFDALDVEGNASVVAAMLAKQLVQGWIYGTIDTLMQQANEPLPPPAKCPVHDTMDTILVDKDVSVDSEQALVARPAVHISPSPPLETLSDKCETNTLCLLSSMLAKQLVQMWLYETMGTISMGSNSDPSFCCSPKPATTIPPSQHESHDSEFDWMQGKEATIASHYGTSNDKANDDNIGGDAASHPNPLCLVTSKLAHQLVQSWIYGTLDDAIQRRTTRLAEEAAVRLVERAPTLTHLSSLTDKSDEDGLVTCPAPTNDASVGVTARGDDKADVMEQSHCVASAMLAKQLVQVWLYEAMDTIVVQSFAKLSSVRAPIDALEMGAPPFARSMFGENELTGNVDVEDGSHEAIESSSQYDKPPIVRLVLKPPHGVNSNVVPHDDGENAMANDMLSVEAAILAQQLVHAWIYETLDTVTRFSAHPHEHHNDVALRKVIEPATFENGNEKSDWSDNNLGQLAKVVPPTQSPLADKDDEGRSSVVAAMVAKQLVQAWIYDTLESLSWRTMSGTVNPNSPEADATSSNALVSRANTLVGWKGESEHMPTAESLADAFGKVPLEGSVVAVEPICQVTTNERPLDEPTMLTTSVEAQANESTLWMVSAMLAKQLVQTWIYDTMDVMSHHLSTHQAPPDQNQMTRGQLDQPPWAKIDKMSLRNSLIVDGQRSPLPQSTTSAADVLGHSFPQDPPSNVVHTTTDNDDVNDDDTSLCLVSAILTKQLVQAWIYEALGRVVQLTVSEKESSATIGHAASATTQPDATIVDEYANDDFSPEGPTNIHGEPIVSDVHPASPTETMQLSPSTPASAHQDDDTGGSDDDAVLNVLSAIVAKQLVQAWIYETLETVARFSSQPPEHNERLAAAPGGTEKRDASNPPKTTDSDSPLASVLVTTPTSPETCLLEMVANGTALVTKRDVEGAMTNTAVGDETSDIICIVSASLANQLVQTWLYETIDTIINLSQQHNNVATLDGSRSIDAVVRALAPAKASSATTQHTTLQVTRASTPTLANHNPTDIQDQESSRHPSVDLSILVSHMVRGWLFEGLLLATHARLHENCASQRPLFLDEGIVQRPLSTASSHDSNPTLFFDNGMPRQSTSSSSSMASDPETPFVETIDAHGGADDDVNNEALSVAASILAAQLVQAWIFGTLAQVTQFTVTPHEHDRAVSLNTADDHNPTTVQPHLESSRIEGPASPSHAALAEATTSPPPQLDATGEATPALFFVLPTAAFGAVVPPVEALHDDDPVATIFTKWHSERRIPHSSSFQWGPPGATLRHQVVEYVQAPWTHAVGSFQAWGECHGINLTIEREKSSAATKVPTWEELEQSIADIFVKWNKAHEAETKPVAARRTTVYLTGASSFQAFVGEYVEASMAAAVTRIGEDMTCHRDISPVMPPPPLMTDDSNEARGVAVALLAAQLTRGWIFEALFNVSHVQLQAWLERP
ncbi:Aste57867_11118 [Aphanomyces stellatus]|uniref:Aste57867_11118 protein n=1 Tax=Aphanomyces stellatus TaxID=120398 RepID=A0A485KS77_9STRA|nr:hypothetical protein As57867_011076 [Aphanomyces stellatus]VFT87985.1 Aste57867_11118 [Aphanomyces stellatus]